MYDIKMAELGIHNPELLNSIQEVLKSGKFIKGSHNQHFSELWSDKCGAYFCVPTASGTAALQAVLYAFSHGFEHIPDRRCIIVPEFSFVATAQAVHKMGFTPVYCKVLGNGLIDQEHCLELIEKYNPTAVIMVHIFGQHLKIDQRILNQCVVIEDACQAHGIKLQGTAACFSFYPSKVLGAAGDAGAVVTDIPGLANMIETYANYGDSPKEKYVHSIIGDNLRMDEIQAAILNWKLETGLLEEELRVRRQQASYYFEQKNIRTIATYKNYTCYLYPILVHEGDRAWLRKQLKEEGIETGNHYPYLLQHLVPGIDSEVNDPLYWGYAFHKNIVTLPIGSHITLGDVSNVAKVLNKYASPLLMDSQYQIWHKKEELR